MKPWFHRNLSYRWIGISMPGLRRDAGWKMAIWPARREGWIALGVIAGLLLAEVFLLPALVGESFLDGGREWDTRAVAIIPTLLLSVAFIFAFSGPAEKHENNNA
ncbi:hypothetical protein [Maricaulis sp. MIT060901]|uniref:hypothetical protein n=1 Tax=Maricaulis sp. MIT060901 TaxID=3096993 RepID=UPI00399A8574